MKSAFNLQNEAITEIDEQVQALVKRRATRQKKGPDFLKGLRKFRDQ